MKCPACLNLQFSSTQLDDDIRINTCSGCGLIISGIRRHGPATPEFSFINDAEYQRSIGALRQHQAREILQFIRQHVKVGGDWLDVGCSFGYLLFDAKKAGFRIFGVEPDAKAADDARALLGEGCVQHGLMDNATRADASADIISMLDVLEHIPLEVLPEFAGMIHRKLRPGGHWLIKVPSTEGLYFTLAHRLRPLLPGLFAGTIKRLWQSEYEYPHTVYFNLKTLQLFLEQHGFAVQAATYLAEVPNDTILDRLRMDNTIPQWQTLLMAPALYLINFIEKLRGKSDALLVLASRGS